jgi:hypothetical protein
MSEKVKVNDFPFFLRQDFPLPPFIPVTLCVDCCIVYDNSAKGIKGVFDMLLICFCASHKKPPIQKIYGKSIFFWFSKETN